jgi:hypothetical protein
MEVLRDGRINPFAEEQGRSLARANKFGQAMWICFEAVNLLGLEDDHTAAPVEEGLGVLFELNGACSFKVMYFGSTEQDRQSGSGVQIDARKSLADGLIERFPIARVRNRKDGGLVGTKFEYARELESIRELVFQ